MRERAARFLDRTIFSLLLAVISLTAILCGTTDEPWWEAVVEYAVFALMLLWTVEGLLSGSWLVREHRLLVPLLALTVFAFAQTLPLSGANVTEALAIKSGLRWTISADPYETRLFAFRLLAVVMAGGFCYATRRIVGGYAPSCTLLSESVWRAPCSASCGK